MRSAEEIEHGIDRCICRDFEAVMDIFSSLITPEMPPYLKAHTA
jgi:hypothetical protein